MFGHEINPIDRYAWVGFFIGALIDSLLLIYANDYYNIFAGLDHRLSFLLYLAFPLICYYIGLKHGTKVLRKKLGTDKDEFTTWHDYYKQNSISSEESYLSTDNYLSTKIWRRPSPFKDPDLWKKIPGYKKMIILPVALLWCSGLAFFIGYIRIGLILILLLLIVIIVNFNKYK